ncbi:MAG: arginyl-tRNA synthetase [Glaciecola sp.]|jgi:arginyl-tRNA synthetase
MKSVVEALLSQAIDTLKHQGVIAEDVSPRINLSNTKDKSHGDFACNIAMMLAKPTGMNPRELAEKIITAMPQDPRISDTQIAGPGFINFFVNDRWLEQQVSHALADDYIGIKRAVTPQTIVVDYSSPNLAKEMHVGHLRSSIIGDAVVRALEFQGHNVIRQNHVGDWGTQFGMLLAYMEEQQNNGESLDLADLEGFYRASKGRFDESEKFAIRARELVVALQSGDEYCNKLWKEFNSISLEHCLTLYKRLGVSLTAADVRGESAYNNDLQSIVDELTKANLLTESNGAQCVFLDEFKNKEGDALPIIVQKSGGGFLYATSDLAAIRYRAQQLHADRVLYFVDQRQALHFNQVFALAYKAGFANEDVSLEHLGFGTMNGEDGKPFKTRSGGTVKLVDLLDEAEVRAIALVRSKNPDMGQAEVDKIGKAVGISAVKYADLSKDRARDYIFNFDQMLSFEGNTAPYLMYAYTRVASIFDKAGLDMNSIQGEVKLAAEKEKDLANKLMQFPEILERISQRGQPHTLCSYIYEVAGLFSSFYEHCPILSAETEDQKMSRLRLAALAGKTIKQGLNLLGIETLERM